MTIQINKNLDNYKEKVVMGLTARQLIHVIICVGVCALLVFILHHFIGIMLSALICFPVVAPIALNGFYEWNGLGFVESMKLRLVYMLKNRPLIYSSDSESELVIEEFKRKQEFEERAKAKKEKKGRGLLSMLLPSFMSSKKNDPVKETVAESEEKENKYMAVDENKKSGLIKGILGKKDKKKKTKKGEETTA